jgi:hypothetical protein
VTVALSARPVARAKRRRPHWAPPRQTNNTHEAALAIVDLPCADRHLSALCVFEAEFCDPGIEPEGYGREVHPPGFLKPMRLDRAIVLPGTEVSINFTKERTRSPRQQIIVGCRFDRTAQHKDCLLAPSLKPCSGPLATISQAIAT